MSNLTFVNATLVPGPANTAGYVEALQVCASILTMFLFGWFWKIVGVTGPTRALLRAFNAFMFNVGIPALALKGEVCVVCLV